MDAGANGIPQAYSCGHQYYFVIGGDGLVRWRGSWNYDTVRNQVQAALDELSATAAGDVPQREFALGESYPNPFNPNATIPYELRGEGGDATVRLDILDLRGRVVRTLFTGSQVRGRNYNAVWNGRDDTGQSVASGLYMSRLSVDGNEQARMMTLVK